MNLESYILQSCTDLTIESLEKLGEGDFCRAFLVNQTLVFRFAKHAEAQQSLMRENCLLRKIDARISVRIPQPRTFNFDGKPQNSFVSYDFLSGETLTREKYLLLDEEKRTACAASVADFLNEFHAIDLRIAVDCDVPQIDYAAKYSKLLADLRKDFRARLDRRVFEFAERQIEDFLDCFDSKTPRKVLLHGDLSPDHVLFDGERVTAIIDFGDMMIGDAAWDFLWIYEDYGADFFARALAKYQTNDKKSFARRVLRFSNLEAVQWIADCLENGEQDLAQAIENLKKLADGQSQINSIFENLQAN